MTKKRAIDRIDLNILSILQNDARITNHELSSKVNLSPSSCLQRVRRLEDEGYLESYMAVINLNKICRTVTVLLTVSLHDHTNANFKTFEKVINEFPEIVECFTVSGNFDYFLRIVCPDMDRYLELNDKLIESMEGVANISSHVALATSKSFKGYALDKLVD
ncbi:Lrp/AsnC family transcriptional regulator [Paremcibacter congregatus]|uniref:Transcriptional regulator n=1 Tax=Paremcibacter congregatus TaxID=2043170 RepID=A0A2G4YNA8_9PROT|nr:Lrp/AsnC family transcriptional regulator [Paremcibacter congregatus]PHZ83800.1 transcriptional regulator [Paremcibacter congregatus]QDE27503.1 Lrp/AsnC family transcriptional regulator [Paremcibacter congregatus]|tara:strand:- start:188 stop:673 length:486 start_codon:yes stop_codon:yes gene_type:complete